SWLLVWLLSLAVRIFKRGPNARSRRRSEPDSPLHAVYLRATLVPGGTEFGGGLTAHVLGFIAGAAELGHNLTVVTSGELDIAAERVSGVEIEPSSFLGATRSLLELYNNLRFTILMVNLDHTIFDSADFIYQRYSRFNFSGVVLSLITGL